jgi:hypothetical protein
MCSSACSQQRDRREDFWSSGSQAGRQAGRQRLPDTRAARAQRLGHLGVGRRPGPTGAAPAPVRRHRPSGRSCPARGQGSTGARQRRRGDGMTRVAHGRADRSWDATRGIRNRYREAWLGDLEPAATAGLRGSRIAIDAVLFSATLGKNAPEMSGPASKQLRLDLDDNKPSICCDHGYSINHHYYVCRRCDPSNGRIHSGISARRKNTASCRTDGQGAGFYCCSDRRLQ